MPYASCTQEKKKQWRAGAGGRLVRGERVNQRYFLGKSKWKLDTPCLVLAEEILRQNIQTMQAHATCFGKQLRPHAKTHKCSTIARMQTAAGGAGICVAKVAEAEVLVARGLRGGRIP